MIFGTFFSMIAIIMIILSVIGIILSAAGDYKKEDTLYELAKYYKLNYNGNKKIVFGEMKNKNYEIVIKKENHKDLNTISITIKFKNKIFENFVIRQKSLFDTFIEKDEGITLGDYEFDEKNVIKSKLNPTILAISNCKFRNGINLLGKYTEDYLINEKKIKAWFSDDNGDAKSVMSRIDPCIKLADEISKIKNLKESILENIKNDPHKKIRVINFRVFMENYKSTKEGKVLLDKMKNSRDIDDQILAAEYLDNSMDFLLSLLKNKTLDRSKIYDILELLEKKKVKDDYNVLKEVIKKYNDDEITAAVIHTMGELKLSQFEKYIFDNIDNENREISENSVEALKICGTKKIIEPLHKMSEKTINPIKKKRLHETIAQIQSRLGNVEKGWVSVPEEKDLDGALSKEDVGKKGMLSREAK